jgi:phosphohistidine phosphatase SixA
VVKHATINSLRRNCCAVFLALFLSSPVLASLADELSDGRHVLLMRHADAPGFSDPAGYRLDQCGTQRNLGEAGKAQAVRTGQWLSEQGIRQAIVFSSPWCRCIDTASLLNKGPVTIEPSLGSFFGNMSLAKQQTEGLRQLVQASLKRYPQTPIIMVSHHVNIEAYTGVVLGSGEMILVRVDPKGKPLSHRVLAALR